MPRKQQPDPRTKAELLAELEDIEDRAIKVSQECSKLQRERDEAKSEAAQLRHEVNFLKDELHQKTVQIADQAGYIRRAQEFDPEEQREARAGQLAAYNTASGLAEKQVFDRRYDRALRDSVDPMSDQFLTPWYRRG